MKLKILIAVYVVVALICGKVLLNYFYNESVINAYEDENYSVNDDMLLALNVFEPYIAHYNNANILYKMGQYQEAFDEYQAAIDCGIPHYTECPVRINQALSVIAQLDKNYKDPANIEKSLELLYQARDILLEDGCADKKGKGHSKKAERLKRDIEAA
ncbi:MAG: hypothetical protein J6Z43_04325, partial [Clostridiales bacterium]|nr:hypothetical protein [Clostridiales bacterium]